MLIIPAIDLKDGRCVRLLQGRKDAETVFSTDPGRVAKRWQSEGAELLHVIDLDGAFTKYPRNLDSIKMIVANVSIPIQVGGGIRNTDTVKLLLDLGIDRIILGTEALRNPQWVFEIAQDYPDRIIVGIDARNGMVAVEGWTETSTVTAVEFARRFDDAGILAINFTDIHRDGMQTGVNITETKKLAQAIDTPVIASGGVSTIDDIANLLPLQASGVIGVIVGKALYAGTLKLNEALALSR
jgi:phosphoribosylformimino-5-aminoimidazole carboxamide ribotide isomerase